MKQTEEFIAHGIYTISNTTGIEVQISNCGDSARCRYINSKDEEEISEWLEIIHDTIPSMWEHEEYTSIFYYDELQIDLNQVIRINN
jgi:hypothetical protein